MNIGSSLEFPLGRRARKFEKGTRRFEEKGGAPHKNA
jgi:hypothetical protein